jgi:hypothetical protein
MCKFWGNPILYTLVKTDKNLYEVYKLVEKIHVVSNMQGSLSQPKKDKREQERKSNRQIHGQDIQSTCAGARENAKKTVGTTKQ